MALDLGELNRQTEEYERIFNNVRPRKAPAMRPPNEYSLLRMKNQNLQASPMSRPPSRI